MPGKSCRNPMEAALIRSSSIRLQSFRLVPTPFLSRAFAYRADNRIFLTSFLPTLSILLPKSYTFLHFPTLSYTPETRSPSNFPTLSYTFLHFLHFPTLPTDTYGSCLPLCIFISCKIYSVHYACKIHSWFMLINLKERLYRPVTK